jgi:hypothetical protein
MQMENIRIKRVAGEEVDTIVLQTCYVDLCDCDPDAKDNCEDCTCGLAWVTLEEKVLATVKKDDEVVFVDKDVPFCLS